jgi:hypothetical protein
MDTKNLAVGQDIFITNGMDLLGDGKIVEITPEEIVVETPCDHDSGIMRFDRNGIERPPYSKSGIWHPWELRPAVVRWMTPEETKQCYEELRRKR